MSFWNSKIINWLRLLAILIVAAAAVKTAGDYLVLQRKNWNPANLTDDPVTNWQARCAQLREDLPRLGEVGYISEWDLPGWKGSQSDMDNEYRLTQYALVPHILVRGSGFDYVVGNLTDPDTIGTAEKLYRIKAIHSYGLGIYLFKRVGP